MVLQTYKTDGIATIIAEPLTPEAFAPFGGVISADHQIKHAASSSANYGTAIKIHKVSPIANTFAQNNRLPSTANWNIFRCLAPKHLIKHSGASFSYTAKVLERHPYSTQTFLPLGQDLHKPSYLVIVAVTDESTQDKLPSPQLRAFVCRGNQAVTYGAGTWHAPMVVIDEHVAHIDFAVMINENGVADDDCQECYFDPGYTVLYRDPAGSKL